MAAIAEQSGSHERLRHIFSGREPPLLVLLEAPHLLVRHGLADEQHEEQRGGQEIQPAERSLGPHARLMHGRREQPDQEHLPEADEGEVHHLQGHRPIFSRTAAQR